MPDENEDNVVIPELKKPLPIKMDTVIVGCIYEGDDGNLEIYLFEDNDLVQQLHAKIQKDECAGLAILPVRQPAPPRPEFDALKSVAEPE